MQTILYLFINFEEIINNFIQKKIKEIIFKKFFDFFKRLQQKKEAAFIIFFLYNFFI